MYAHKSLGMQDDNYRIDARCQGAQKENRGGGRGNRSESRVMGVGEWNMGKS